ncbi:proteinase-activated receptor 1-like [Pyxicephalus adspersus]
MNIQRFDLETNDLSDQTSLEIPDELLGYFQSPWLTRFIPSVYIAVFLISLPLNIIAIIIFLFIVKVNTPAVVFMLNLAAADIHFVSMLPFIIFYRFSGNNWVIGEGMCRFVTAAFYCNMYCSILLMSAISVDRLLAVVYPVRSLLWRTVSRAWLTCLFIWLLSIAGTVPLLVSNLTVHLDQLNITTCYDILSIEDIQIYYFHYFTAFISTFFFVPLIITTVSYALTIRSLSSPTIESNFKKSRAVLLCVTVLCEFIMCFGPTNTIFLVYYLNFDKPFGSSLYFAYIISVSISSISCCLDPLIYYYGSAKCKKYVYNLMCCDKAKAGDRDTGRNTSSTIPTL